MERIKIDFKLPVSIKKDGDWYISSCPPLDVFSQGETEAKAKKNIIEALCLFLTSCFERGVLNQVLHQCGFKNFDSAHPPAFGSSDFVHVPIHLLASQKNNSSCHA